VSLRDRIKLVVMASGAVDGQPEERLPNDRHHVFQFFFANPRLHDRAHLAIAGFVPWAANKHAGGNDSVSGDRLQYVSGNLFLDKAGVRYVVIEALNHVVAVPPGMVPDFIVLITMAFAVAYEIEPVTSPSFAIA